MKIGDSGAVDLTGYINTTNAVTELDGLNIKTKDANDILYASKSSVDNIVIQKDLVTADNAYSSHMLINETKALDMINVQVKNDFNAHLIASNTFESRIAALESITSSTFESRIAALEAAPSSASSIVTSDITSRCRIMYEVMQLLNGPLTRNIYGIRGNQ